MEGGRTRNNLAASLRLHYHALLRSNVNAHPCGSVAMVTMSYVGRLGGPAETLVLEVGCVDGRLTWRYAGVASRSVYAVDPNAARLSRLARPTGE